MNNLENRDWSNILKCAFDNPDYRGTLDKEERLLFDLALKGELGENVTVLCCGDGREMEIVLNSNAKYPQVKTLKGVDILEISKTQINSKISDGLWQTDGVDVEVLVEDARKTSIEKHTQDTVLMLLTLVNFSNEFIDSLFKHVYDILKPDGKFIFSVFNQHALYTRMKVYREGNAPIKWVTTDGFVKFIDGWDEAEFSRQFRPNDVNDICLGSGFARPNLDSSFITHLAVVYKQSYVDQLNAQRRNKALMACALFLMMINNIYANQSKQECNGVVRTIEVAPGGGTHEFCIEDL